MLDWAKCKLYVVYTVYEIINVDIKIIIIITIMIITLIIISISCIKTLFTIRLYFFLIETIHKGRDSEILRPLKPEM